MKENGLIQVLWVEDDPTVTKTYPLKAEIFDLQLVPFPCWDDAKIALERDYDKSCLTLITCTKNSKTEQTVFIFELI